MVAGGLTAAGARDGGPAGLSGSFLAGKRQAGWQSPTGACLFRQRWTRPASHEGDKQKFLCKHNTPLATSAWTFACFGVVQSKRQGEES